LPEMRKEYCVPDGKKRRGNNNQYFFSVEL
jgi:hypothetical protein